MSTNLLLPPTAFLECPGTPRIPFRNWLTSFENYLIAIDGNAFSDTRKKAMLVHCLGTEGQRIFNTLPPPSTTFEEAISALRAFFSPKVNVVAERYKFRQRAQAEGESTDQYVSALRELVVTCEFGSLESEMVRDQLIEKTAITKVRERLLLESELSLDKALSLARHIEAAMQEAKLLAHHDPFKVSAITDKYKTPHKEDTRKTSKPNTNGSAKSCFRCGSYSHLANKKICPAKDATCKNCHKVGHFASVCRSSPADVCKPQNHNGRRYKGTVPEVTILNVDSRNQNSGKILCTATIFANGSPKPTKLVVDTGSDVSILPLHTFLELFGKHTTLQAPKRKLVTYAGQPLKVLGCVQAKTQVGTSAMTVCFYIVKDGNPILGLDMFRNLHLQLTVSPNSTTIAPTVEMPTRCGNVQMLTTGCAVKFCHKVKVKEGITPVRQKLRRLPVLVRNAVSEELKRLQADGIIEPVDAAEWISPIVVIKKKTGDIRVCVDLREPNKAVVLDGQPLPIMEDIFDKLHGAVMFSTIDLKTAYYQLPLHEDSRDLTTFITHEGLFRFCRVPYGLCSAPAAFQKMMYTVLKELSGVESYYDDLLVYGSTPEEHDANLEATIRRLSENGLQMNSPKCNFRKTELQFLGFLLSAKGISPTVDHLHALKDAPEPTNATELRSFLGFVSWYSRFVPNFAKVVEPLRSLTKKGQTFIWTEDADKSFRQIKDMILHSDALKPFNNNLPIIVSTDASDYGIGAALTQLQADGTEATVAFASRTLSETERKYSIVEKEALACVWAVERWRTWLWGRRCKLRTDHQALTTLLSSRGNDRAGMRIARWSARLLPFHYDVEYRKGCLNSTADCFSRLPARSHEETKESEEDTLEIAQIESNTTAVSQEEFREHCRKCPTLSNLRAQINKGWPRKSKDVTPDLQKFYHIKDELAVFDDLVTRGTYRTIVPTSLQNRLLELAHQTHQGITRTKQRLREKYWWPGMDLQVENFIRNCGVCMQHDKTAVRMDPPLQIVELPSEPWQKIAIDIMGPFVHFGSNMRYLLTVIDYRSKWPEVALLDCISTDAVIRALDLIFAREGFPEFLVSDNGTQFTNARFSEYLRARGIKHIRSSNYYPQSNGEIERFNRVVKDAAQTSYITGIPWKKFLLDFLMEYRATPHATTGLSPAEVLHGRKHRTKLDTFPIDNSLQVGRDIDTHVRQKQLKYKKLFDSKRNTSTRSFQKGDSVRVLQTRKKSGKRQPKYSSPRIITQQVAPYTYRLDDGKIWNASKFSLMNYPENMPTEEAEPEEKVVRRSDRTKKPPSWLKDYVT